MIDTKHFFFDFSFADIIIFRTFAHEITISLSKRAILVFSSLFPDFFSPSCFPEYVVQQVVVCFVDDVTLE